ncbi:RelA/SpoT domain-containing protein [Hyalangium sp.]|uniref:RelA/SpoT domain-containing protein n=1 Tax=Hyalangium sp. TaxID=2028555 RepID=UPI002D2251D5|nr:RelA/SpoT domain-containing protein [Hyalangium sp.]HYH98630.1 RelA/SpoT domain-containing protein [Hyalangium sp.]
MAGPFFMTGELAPFTRRLLDQHFESWREGKPRSREERLTEVLAWIEEQTRPYEAVGLALIAQLGPLLTEIQQGLPVHERRRFLFRVDAAHLRKSPESILEKMAREWHEAGTEAPPKSFHNLADLKDLGRFRIVANFLSDVELLCDRLEITYDASRRRSLSPAQQHLAEGFRLIDNSFEDLIRVRPPKRKSGERCRKGLFAPRDPSQGQYRIEVQIVTAFQEGWDKKDHHLVYERVRTGQSLHERHREMSFALSETLYIADSLFDDLKRTADASSRSRSHSPRRR